MNATRKRFSLRAVCAFLALAGCLLLAGCGAAVPDADISADLQAIYRATVPEPYYRGNVIFYGA